MPNLVAVNGVRLAYDEAPGSGERTLVFVHGYPFNRKMWAPQLDALAGVARCTAYDVRGFGESGRGPVPLTLELFADDLVALISALHLERPIVVGLSMGGYILLRAYEKHPEIFGGLVLCDTKSEADSEEARSKRRETIGQIEEHGRDKFADGFLGRVFAPESLATNASAVTLIHEAILGTSTESLVDGQRALMNRSDTTGVLPSISVPTMLIVGLDDTLTPPAVMIEMQQAIKGAELHVIPGAGHVSNIEQPEAFNAHLRAFLGRCT